MLEFTNKVALEVEVKTKLSLTEEEVFLIMDNAFGGGITHWAGVDNGTEAWKDKPKEEPMSTWATKILLEGGQIEFYDREEDDEFKPLTLKVLMDGYAQNYKERAHDRSVEDGDAITADCIIQYALFGEQVYS